MSVCRCAACVCAQSEAESCSNTKVTNGSETLNSGLVSELAWRSFENLAEVTSNEVTSVEPYGVVITNRHSQWSTDRRINRTKSHSELIVI